MRTAFQIGAFQFNAFQEGLAVGSGGWRYAWLIQNAIRRRRVPEPLPSVPDVVEVLAEARERARLNFRTAPRVTDLGPLAELLTQREQAIEMAEFRQLLEALADTEELA